MNANGKYSSDSKEFYLKEYESLRKEIEAHWAYMRSLEWYVAAAVGATWAWLVTHPSPPLPKWTWLIPILFVLLGALRGYGIWKQFENFNEYVKRIEAAFSGTGDPGGWEHFLRTASTTLFQSTGIFWVTLSIATIAVAVYEFSN